MKKSNLYVCFIIFIAIIFSCKESNHVVSEASNTERTEFIKTLKKDFLGRVGIMTYTKPYLISNRIFKTYNNLDSIQARELSMTSIFKNSKSTSKFGLERQIGLKKDINTFVAYQFDENEQMIYKLVNYTKNYDVIDAINVSYFDLTTKMNATETYMYSDTLYVDNKIKGLESVYVFQNDGTFNQIENPEPFNYKPLKQYNHLEVYLEQFEKRVVKAKNGLLIRDASGIEIGKFNYLETISVLDYSEEVKSVSDDGQIIKGRIVKVIKNPRALNKEANFYINSSNIGYVFEGFLFHNPTTDIETYKYAGLTVNKDYLVQISLEELFDVKPIKLKNYLNKVIKTPVINNVTKLYKKDRLVTLTAENENVVTYKDTTYQSEYEPTKTFSVFEDSNFKNNFIVGSTMLFSYQEFRFIDKKTGAKNDYYYGGYPYVSPNGNMVISVDYDGECPNQRTLFIDSIKDGKIIKKVEIFYNLDENSEIDFVNTTNQTEIFWLSDKSFILKFWGATGCYDDTDNYFYYKYELKDELLDLLEYKL